MIGAVVVPFRPPPGGWAEPEDVRDGIRNGEYQIEACGELKPELCLYRDVTRSMLRRYMQMSVELGRLPSLIGREFFRSRVTSYRVHSFEDVVIFVHDMERCLSKLEVGQQKVIARVVLQDYPYDEAAPLLGCTRKTVRRRTDEALDELTAILLEVGLLNEKARGRAVKG